MTTPASILAAVHEATGVSPDSITSDKRTAQVATARFLAMRIYAETHPWSSNQDAAKSVGKLDPSTGRHGLMRAAYMLENDPAFRDAHKRVLESINQPTNQP